MVVRYDNTAMSPNASLNTSAACRYVSSGSRDLFEGVARTRMSVADRCWWAIVSYNARFKLRIAHLEILRRNESSKSSSSASCMHLHSQLLARSRGVSNAPGKGYELNATDYSESSRAT